MFIHDYQCENKKIKSVSKFKYSKSRLLFYTNDTLGGVSGSLIFAANENVHIIKKTNRFVVYGVHTNSAMNDKIIDRKQLNKSTKKDTLNYGVYLHNELILWIRKQIGETKFNPRYTCIRDATIMYLDSIKRRNRKVIEPSKQDVRINPYLASCDVMSIK